MVGLVIVSHSRPLAESLANLVRQVSQTEIPIAYAAGVGEGRLEFGTDATEIAEAIHSVDSPDGVMVLMDLGSAILSAELALELLPPEVAGRVRFCAAPLVEGAIAAGVQASLGSDLEAVCQEARQALLPKAQQLEGEGAQLQAEASVVVPGEPGRTVVVTLPNAYGLHARPAARFVQLAASFDADIQVQNLTNERGPVSAQSLNALATLGAVRDHQIAITASGPQADEALRELQALVKSGFGEEKTVSIETPVPAPIAAATADGAIHAVPVSEGVALGPVYHYQPPPPPIPEHPIENPQEAWTQFEQAQAATRREILIRRQQVEHSLGESQAAIFDAHLLILEDPDLLENVHRRVFEDHRNPAQAWHQSIQEVAANYRALDNPYLQQRALDVEDVGNQLLHHLAGTAEVQQVQLDNPVILVADDLTPTQTAQLDLERILGLVTVGGGPTSHSAILARALGIPAIAGVDASINALPADSLLGLDGFQGALWVNPPAEKQAELQAARDEWLARRAALLRATHEPAATQDGYRVEVAANVGNPMDARAAVKNGAEAVGLLRTEFLFLTRVSPPDEDEQYSALRQIGETLGQRPVIVRTLDVGGDKALPYLDLPVEANPFLGVRAIRLAAHNRDLFHTQLRAILRAGEGLDFRVMFPMVAGLQDVELAKELLAEAHQSLLDEGTPHIWPIEMGIMIETPASALLSPVLAKHVEFFSIGTNDLTQYTLAAERGNPALARFADALNPAVLKLVQQVVQAAHAAGRWVGVCGELAGDAQAVPVLVGLGVDELSLNPGGIPRVKAIIRRLQLADSQQLAQDVLQAANTADTRQLAADFLQSLGEIR